ncbi:MAG: hypothetical protein KF873_07130 [Gemmataceae bacterium]|nr:hypothetical protein [Gemmataceae bacterium]
MRTRILLSAALLVGLALGASAAPAPVIKSTGGPPVILQIAPGQKLLENVKRSSASSPAKASADSSTARSRASSARKASPAST